MAQNKYYIKMPNNITLDLISGGVDQLTENELSLTFRNEHRFTFEQVKEMFSDIDEIVIWLCLVQRDGRETDHMPGEVFDEFTRFSKLEYQEDLDLWKVTLSKPKEIEQRLEELEAALNYLLMGGEE